MKRTMMLSALLVLIAATTFAASNQDYLVVYDGRTSTNGHAIQFLNDYVQRHGGYHMHIMSANQAGGVNPADYRAVVVLNTGRTSGMDPAFTPIVDRRSVAEPGVACHCQPREPTADHRGGDQRRRRRDGGDPVAWHRSFRRDQRRVPDAPAVGTVRP